MDREKVIKGLECCTFILGRRKCNECPYQKGLPDNGCYQLQDDFHAMLNAMEKVDGRYSEDIMNALVNLMKVFLKDHEIYKLMELVADAVATKEQENSHETCTGVSSVQDSCNPQHSKTVVRYTQDKDGWRAGAYVKDPSMFAHGNNTGK